MTTSRVAATRTPGPVMAAALLVGVAGVIMVIANLAASLSWEMQRGRSPGTITAATVTAILFAAVVLLTAFGLVRGWRGAQIATVVLGALQLTAVFGMAGGGVLRVLAGTVVIGLVLVPQSARAWFSR